MGFLLANNKIHPLLLYNYVNIGLIKAIHKTSI